MRVDPDQINWIKLLQMCYDMNQALEDCFERISELEMELEARSDY